MGSKWDQNEFKVGKHMNKGRLIWNELTAQTTIT